MKDTMIILRWREDGCTNQTKVSRKEFYAIFDGLAKGYEKIGDNEISKKLVEIIPEVDEIFINRDWNENQDDPSIQCNTDGDIQIVKIKRRHRIVWSVFEDHCKE